MFIDELLLLRTRWVIEFDTQHYFFDQINGKYPGWVVFLMTEMIKQYIFY